MGKLAFVFAGQGAQAVGMGKELAENFPIADKTFDEASEALGFDIKDMIWNGDSETLMITENTQPTIVTMSVAALRVLQEKGIKPDVVAGRLLSHFPQRTLSLAAKRRQKSVFVHLQTLTVLVKSLYRVKLRQWISVVNWQRKRAQNVL